MPTATIYKINKRGYLLFSSVKTVSGFRVSVEPYIQIPENNTDMSIIVDAIKTVLNTDDNKRVPDPTNWSEFDKLFLQKTGLKSLKDLNKPTTKSIALRKEADNIIFTPTKPAEKPDEGFLHKGKNETITIPIISSNQEIATALEIAFSKCE